MYVNTVDSLGLGHQLTPERAIAFTMPTSFIVVYNNRHSGSELKQALQGLFVIAPP